MPKFQVKAGTTSHIERVLVLDSSSTTGAGLTGLVYNAASLECHFIRKGATTPTDVTLAAITTLGTWVSGGLKLVSDAKMPGLVEFGVPDAALAAAAGVDSVVVYLFGATNMVPVRMEIKLTGTDDQDAVRGGLTALPNVVPTSPGGLIVSGTAAYQINPDGAGNVPILPATVTKIDTIKTVTDGIAAAELIATVTAASSATSFTVSVAGVTAVQLAGYKGRTCTIVSSTAAATVGTQGAIQTNTASGSNSTLITLFSTSPLGATPTVGDVMFFQGAGATS